jgi:hypothetical protein
LHACGTGRAATETTVTIPDGKPLWTQKRSIFARGEGGFGGERGPSTSSEPTERAPDFELSIAVSPQQALLYRMCGDRNPLHSDPNSLPPQACPGRSCTDCARTECHARKWWMPSSGQMATGFRGLLSQAGTNSTPAGATASSRSGAVTTARNGRTAAAPPPLYRLVQVDDASTERAVEATVHGVAGPVAERPYPPTAAKVDDGPKCSSKIC